MKLCYEIMLLRIFKVNLRYTQDLQNMANQTNSTTTYLEQFKEIHQYLSNVIGQSFITLNIQRQIYQEFISIFIKFSKKIATLSNRINQEILKSQSDEATVNTYQFLSNCLLRMGQCSRKVALKGKNQVLDPLVVFGNNYEMVCRDMIGKFGGCLVLLTRSDLDLKKSRENYINASDKLEKYKEMQQKMISKVEQGELAQLQKLNTTIRKLTQTINECEKAYQHSVQKINTEWSQSKTHLNSISVSMEHNEESRISFVRRSVQSSIKLLQQFNNAFDSQINQKLEESNSRMLNTQKTQVSIDRRLLTKMSLLVSTEISEQFVSYEEMNRNKKRTMEEESSHLAEIFTKVSENDKLIMQQIIKSWLKGNKPTKQKKIQQKEKGKQSPLNKSQKQIPNFKKIRSEEQKSKQSEGKVDQQVDKLKGIRKNIQSQIEMETEQCGKKITSFQPYSFYFVEILYQKITQMTSFYLKIEEENFMMLLNFFQLITNNLDLSTEINIELIYKMIQISMRVTRLRSYTANNQRGQTIQLLCYTYGKLCKCFVEDSFLNSLLKYIEKRKAIKKKSTEKSVMGIAKGFYAAMLGKKATMPSLSEEQLFNCLEELTNIMANLSLPKQVCLKYLKPLAVNSSGQYDYLGGIILTKRDQEERQKILFGNLIKRQQKQEFVRKSLQSKHAMGIFCLNLIAKKGFLNNDDKLLRLVSRQLVNVHQQILFHLKIESSKKWPMLIPYKKSIDYLQMKQEVAQNSVPSQIQQIITLDVNRSLHLHGDYFNPTLLHSLLRTYAYYHTDISYCQGMNYIAGYIYIKTLAEEKAYRIFEHLMTIRFHELFINEFKNLKVKMYLFQRLLAIFHPDISEHFKRQYISPQCYIVSWIITLFASTYQYTMHSYLVDVLWERFIIYGWGEFYKFVLWLFGFFKDQLLQMSYDKALHFLGELGRSEMFQASPQVFQEKYKTNVNSQMDKYYVTEELLIDLKKQFDIK